MYREDSYWQKNKSHDNELPTSNNSSPTNNEFQYDLASNSSRRDFLEDFKPLYQQRMDDRLPPMGFFWDIENCQVPKSKSASSLVQKIRAIFLRNHRESEFIVVCDVMKEQAQIIQDLHDSQVNLIHVSGTSKNAADEKLRQTLRRFAEVHPAPSSIVLISSDINFASDLYDLRYRKKIYVILIHNVNVADSLISIANEHHSFPAIAEHLPAFKIQTPPPCYLTITNLPLNSDAKKIKLRLKFLTDNCGGRTTGYVPEEGVAYIRFSNFDAAQRVDGLLIFYVENQYLSNSSVNVAKNMAHYKPYDRDNRAQKRIQGEDVFGNKIQVLTSSHRNYAGRKIKHCNSTFHGATSLQNISQSPIERRQDFSQNESCTFRPIRGGMTPMDMNYDPIWSQRRRPRGPQEQLYPLSNRTHKISGSSEFSDDGKEFFMNQRPVDLLVSNLDSTIELKELKRHLLNMLKEFAMILNLNITVQSDGAPIANIRVNSQQEAQFIISQLHRQKIGNKRIVISYAQNNSPDPSQLKAMVIGLLHEVPDNRMPLFKFIELFESRYHCLVSVSEVKKLKDICKITDELGPRIISLTQGVISSPTPDLNGTMVPYCPLHCTNLQSRGWCETSYIQSANIIMPLKTFASKLNHLLNIHMGCMHLLSFQNCYESEYQEPLPVDSEGVPLEHLISCVPKIELQLIGPNKNIKVIAQENKTTHYNEDSVLKTFPVSLAPNISLLCRELVDLLKTTDKCQLLLNKFIPAYHHHFGRQCRVADYGYTKLLDLFESIPHVAQIMGDGSRKVITLSHSAQVRRFTSDLLRVLKMQSLKQMTLTEFPSAYEKVMNKPFNAVEYGLCTFDDLLQEVPENTIVINKLDQETIISLPKREQTPEEVMRTKQFASEVIDLLKHTPYYTMLFNKFVPAYHHHFGHQCKVSDYGFTKLIELFEAIPEIIKITELPDGERIVTLTLEQSLKILGSQILQALKGSKLSSIELDELPNLYLQEVGYPLKPNCYDCETVAELVYKLSDYIEVIHSNAGTLLVAIDMDTIPTLLIRGWALLLNPPHCKDFTTFKYEYQLRYNSSFSPKSLQELQNVFTISKDTNYICLTDLFSLAALVYKLVYNNGGTLLFENLEKYYYNYYGESLKLSNYSIYSIDEFYNHFNMFFFFRGKKKSVIVLKRSLSEHFIDLPPSFFVPSQLGDNVSATTSMNPSGKSGEFKEREVVQWPNIPDVETFNSTIKKISPPKPDTPPTPDNTPWSIWSSPSALNEIGLSINMPILHNPKLLANTDSLVSPAKHLLPANGNSIWTTIMPTITAPDPQDVPMPDKLINKGITSDDSADSGVNTKLESSPSHQEIEVSFESFNGHNKQNPKRPFATILNFNN